jgi:cell wall-associated NlpC family hydrolase
LNGVLLPRDANQQELVGEPIEIDDDYSRLQVGDLVFFGANATSDGPRRVTHVGIYLSDKKFIHESGDVHINSFDPADPLYSEYRTRSLLSARRIIGAGKNVGIKRFAETPLYKREL